MIFTLYRFYDAEDVLLYIGLTINPGRRLVEHRGEKSWWNEIARITLEQYPDLDTLRLAERSAIHLERPLYNVSMNNRPPLVLDQVALAEGCSEWVDETDDWCPELATHLTGSNSFVCVAHTSYYTETVRVVA